MPGAGSRPVVGRPPIRASRHPVFSCSLHRTTDHEIGPSLQEIGRWPLALIQLHQRLAPYFARREPRQHALLYLQAIGSSIPRKNGWQIAEHAKQARPYGMQRLLSRAIWDEDGVRDELRAYVLQSVNSPSLLQIGKQSCDVLDAPFPVYVLERSVVFPNGARTQLGSRCSIAARPGRWTTVKWASFSPM